MMLCIISLDYKKTIKSWKVAGILIILLMPILIYGYSILKINSLNLKKWEKPNNTK